MWAIVAAAAALRLWGLWFGLPHARARPDETAAISIAIAVARGDPNPHFFHWPSFQLYALALIFRVDALLRGEARDVLGALPFGHYAMLGRAWVALSGVLTVPAVFLLGRRISGLEAGVAAAAFLAVAPLHVRDSHFAMTDVTMTWLVISSLWLLAEGAARFEKPQAATWTPVRGSGLWTMCGAGVVGGLATGTKYTAAAILVPAALAHVWVAVKTRPRVRLRVVQSCLAFLGCWGVGFVVSTPFAVLDYPTFSADLLFDVEHLAAGHGPNLGSAWIRHLSFSLPHGLGVATFAAACAGVIVAIRRGGLGNWLVLAFAGAVLLATGRGYTAFARYVMPIIPVACVLAGQAVAALGRVRPLPRRALPLLVAVVAAPSIATSVWLDVLLARTDTRVAAAEWLTAQLPREATVHESGSEYVQMDIRSPGFHRWYYDSATGRFAGAAPDVLPDWLILHRSPLNAYTSVPPAIEALAAGRYTRIRVFAATRGDANPAHYDRQDAFFLPLAGLRDVLRPGPTITVYARRDLGFAGPREP